VQIRDELRRFLAEQGLDLSDDPDDSKPLFGTGRLDSLALFNLVLWIEERTGSAIDPTAFELTREWATVRDIVAFLAARGA